MSGTALSRFIELMNSYGAEKEPFVFIVDYGMNFPEIYKLNSVPPGIKFITPNLSNVDKDQESTKAICLKKYPVSFNVYYEAFKNVQKNIRAGNSYLLNLTFPTIIETEATLKEIFYSGFAKYKLLYNDSFVVFSPEIFVRINNGEIMAYPMKGTIESSVEDAENVIMNDRKEMAEHSTIVDLIRNDLSKVARNVSVTKFRYIDRIKTSDGELLQVSSEITGSLPDGYEGRLGEIIVGLLPAGSVTGAPKKETIRIINESEEYNRGWYTGVFGVFDGKSLDSAVMIRFIEKDSDHFCFKSGGGITFLSDPEKEYNELISKVYVPVG